jgi:hypothetical protein
MQDNQDTKVEEVVENKQENSSISPENEINWKKFREERAADRKSTQEAQALAKRKEEEANALKAAMDALVNRKAPVSDYYYEDRQEETDDERIQKKIDAALAQERKKNEDLQRDRDHKELPNRIRQMYGDWDQIVSQDNEDRLQFDNPELYKAFQHMPDSVDKYAGIYKAIKKLIPNPNSRADEKKVESNFNKPQSMSVGGVTQTGDSAPQILDSKKRTDNWSRMQKVMKGLK